MTPTNNLWRIQGELVELLEAREEALIRAGTTGSPDDVTEREAIDIAIERYVRDKLVQVDDLREPLIALAEGVELCKKRAAAEVNRAMVLQNRYDRLKDSIKQAMQWLEESGYWKPKQTRKLESPHGSFVLKGNGGAQPVEITNEALVPDGYCRFTLTVPGVFWQRFLISLAQVDDVPEEVFEVLRVAAKREVSKSAVAEALNAPCPSCKGVGYTEGPFPGDDPEREYVILDRTDCKTCGGSGKQGVPGARLAPRGESLQIR